ncbi:MAG: hypothetical protein WEA56_16465 [Balneolaceae bacterium]
MRKQYYFRPSENGFYAWDVDRLVKLSEEFEIKEIPVKSIRELGEPRWFDVDDPPTCRDLIGHYRLIQEADLSFPIILSEEGRVMDGMHRVAKAVLEKKRTIKAVQFEEDPDPDFVDVQPDDLPYGSKSPKK